MSTLTLAPDPWQTFFYQSGAPVVGGQLYTYAAGSTTPQATYSEVTGAVQHTNPIILDSAGRAVIYMLPASYRFVLYDAVANGSALIKDQDNIAAIPRSTGYPDVPAYFDQNVTAGTGVYLSAGDGGGTPGHWYPWNSANAYSSTIPQIGMLVADVLSGTIGTVRLLGQMTGLTGLVVGTDYYVGGAGALTTTVGRFVGRADSTTSVILSEYPYVGIRAWTDVPFNAGNFTSDTGAWTVTAPNVIANRYKVIDKTLFWNIILSATTITGTPGHLQIALPVLAGTFNSSSYTRATYLLNNGNILDCLVGPQSTTVLSIFQSNAANFTAGVGSTTLYFSGFWELA